MDILDAFRLLINVSYICLLMEELARCVFSPMTIVLALVTPLGAIRQKSPS